MSSRWRYKPWIIACCVLSIKIRHLDWCFHQTLCSHLIEPNLKKTLNLVRYVIWLFILDAIDVNYDSGIIISSCYVKLQLQPWKTDQLWSPPQHFWNLYFQSNVIRKSTVGIPPPPRLNKSFANFLPDLRLLHQQRGVSGDSNLLLLAVRQHRLPPVRLASRHGKPAHGFLRVLRALQKN